MSSEKSIFVFVTTDGRLRGLTRESDGANLPCNGTTWATNGAIPMTLSALRTFVENPDVAMVNLIMRGYQIVRLTAQVLPFPHRSSS